VAYQIFKDKGETSVCMDDVMECYDVGVFQILQQWHYCNTTRIWQ